MNTRFINTLSTRFPYFLGLLSYSSRSVVFVSLPPKPHKRTPITLTRKKNFKGSFENAFKFDVFVLIILNTHIGRSRQKTKYKINLKKIQKQNMLRKKIC